MSAMSELAAGTGEPLDIDLDAIALALNGEVDGNCVRCPSPGRDPDDRSCHVRLNGGGNIFIYDCEGPLGAAYKAVRAKLGLIMRPRFDHRDALTTIWRETAPAVGSPIETYLRSRAISMPPSDCLRFHPSLLHNRTRSRWLGMVAARTGADGSMVAIHRTFLQPGGRGKAPVDPVRMDLGSTSGTAIRLSPVADHILVGEGIETTMSAMQASGQPGWAAGSAMALRLLVLPAKVRQVTILVDGDDAGKAAAQAAARRWINEGRRVSMAYAPVGKDFNDVLIEELAK